MTTSAPSTVSTDDASASTPTGPAELPPQYDAQRTEPEIYARWQRAGVYTGNPARSNRVGGDREPFVIVMPPPTSRRCCTSGTG